MRVFLFDIFLVSLLLVMTPTEARRAGVLRHKKLVNDGIEPTTNTRLASIESLQFDKQYIVRLQDNTTDVLTAIQQLVGYVGVTIDFIYNDVFKGAAIGNISDTHILRVLDETIVTRASRVSFFKPRLNKFSIVCALIRLTQFLEYESYCSTAGNFSDKCCLGIRSNITTTR